MKFETKEQEKGYLSLLYWMRKRYSGHLERESQASKIVEKDLFFIQKLHDLPEWILQVVGNKFTVVENDMSEVQKRIDYLDARLSELQKICDNKT